MSWVQFVFHLGGTRENKLRDMKVKKKGGDQGPDREIQP